MVFLFVLAAGISAIWMIMPLLQGRDAKFESRLVGALKVVEQEIVASSPDIVDADVFHSPSIEQETRDNRWSLTGIATVKSPTGKTTNQRYIAVVEASCISYTNPKCWRVDKLALENRTVAIGKSVATEPLEATSALSSKTPSAATIGDSQIEEFDQQQQSLVPPADPTKNSSPSLTLRQTEVWP